MRNSATFNDFPYLSPVPPIWHLQFPQIDALLTLPSPHARMLLHMNALSTLLGLRDSELVHRTPPQPGCSPTPFWAALRMSLPLEWPRLCLSCGPLPCGRSLFLKLGHPFLCRLPLHSAWALLRRRLRAQAQVPCTPWSPCRCPLPGPSTRRALTSQARPPPAGAGFPSRFDSPHWVTSCGNALYSQLRLWTSMPAFILPKHDASPGLCELMPGQPHAWKASHPTRLQYCTAGCPWVWCLPTPLSSHPRRQPAATPQSLLQPPGDPTPHIRALLGAWTLHPAWVLTLCMPLTSGPPCWPTEAWTPYSEPPTPTHCWHVADSGKENRCSPNKSAS